ncbi:spore germination protein [Lysinibacillus boronitolerans]|uniref:spore germination protein n=1 Tax=Lysinibacillus boronitolerans TaxID=309788 RepID=UPI0038520F89
MYINKNLSEHIKGRLDDCDDLVTRTFPELEIEVLFFGHLVGEEELRNNIVQPFSNIKNDEVINILRRKEFKQEEDINSMVNGILEGKALVIFKNSLAYVVDIYVPKTRSVSAAEIETVIVGPKEAFIEDVGTNLSMIRRRIKSDRLKVLSYKIGTLTQTKMYLLYIEGITSSVLVKELQERINDIDIKGINDLNQLIQYLDRKPLSIFPQYFTTERPDVSTSKLLEGRVICLLDGSPYSLSTPASFFEFFQSPDDYNQRWLLGTLSRALRFAALVITLFASAFYVAVSMFQYEIIPVKLLHELIKSRSNVPFNPLIEALIIESIIELLREAGARLPSKIGQTIGIVGGIVIGTAAVEAGFTSNILIIVVSISAISSFVVPHIIMTASLRIARFIFIILASIAGFFGIIFGFIILLIHLCSLKNMGEYYLKPIAPLSLKDIKDTIIRAPYQFFKK